MGTAIRWRQRFQNFEKAYFLLKKFVKEEDLNEFEDQGLIKCFEYTYELAWNLMKDYLVYQGVVGIIGSRDAIRQAYNLEIIDQGEEWMKMVDDRKQTVHTYNVDIVEEIKERILSVYYNLYTQLYTKMKTFL